MSAAQATALPGAMNYQLMRLSALQMLQARARTAPPDELGFVMVNETMQVLSYQQAVLWDARRGVAAVSGAERPDSGAPYIRWVSGLLRWLAREPGGQREVTAADAPAALARDWAEWLPARAIWCPFEAPCGRVVAGILLARQEHWGQGDSELVAALAGTYAQSLLIASLPRRRWTRGLRRGLRTRLLLAAGLIAALAAGTAPIRESVLAPAEIVPEHPVLVRAPFAGVVESIDVAPNAPVHAGQVVATMNRTQLQTQAAVARKGLDVAQAELLQATQQAMMDPKARARVAPLAAKVEEQRAELAYQSQLLDRAAITAAGDGLAVYGDPSDWVGKPVEAGERLMLVDPPHSNRLEIHVPVSDAVSFEPGAEVLFFDNVHPDHPRRGAVDFASYGSAATPDGVLAYAFRAALDPGADGGLRLGLKGTAKIYGATRPLAAWVLRKPIMTLRQWLAL